MITEPTTPGADASAIGLVLTSESDFMPVLTLGQPAGTDADGDRVYDYWKEVLTPGDLWDARRRKWHISAQDIDDAIADGNRALSLGHKPLIQDDHYSPTTSYGVIAGFRKNSRGGLEWLHRFEKRCGRSAEENRDLALGKKVSLMLVPNFEDARNRKFKWWPDHSASLFRPQLHDLRDFTPALAASGRTVEAVVLNPAEGDTPMDLTILRNALGDKAKDVPDDQLPAKAVEALQLSASTAADLQLKLNTQTEANGVLARELTEAESARDQALALSADKGGDELDPRVAAMMADNIAGARELALSAGVTPAQAKLFDDLLGADKPNALALSACAGSNRPFAYEFWKTLAKMGSEFIKTQNGVPRASTPAKPLALGAEVEKTAADVTPERKQELLDKAGLSPAK